MVQAKFPSGNSPSSLPVQPASPVNFSINVTEGYSPLTVHFTDQSENATERNWDFGDGTNSTEPNPTHVYSTAGIYTVNLTVSNANGTYSKTAAINVQDESSSSGGSSSGDSIGNAHVVSSSNDINGLTDNTSTIGTTTIIQPKNSTLTPEQSDENAEAGAAPFAYVTNYENNTVSVIDTATNKVTSTVPVGSGPEGIAVTPDGKKVYVANNDSNSVSVIDTATNSVIANINSASGLYGFYNPYGVAVSPDGTKIYVANQDHDTVSVIDAATNTVTGIVDVGSTPCGIALSPDGKKLYVANLDDNTVSVINAATNMGPAISTATVAVGSSPNEVAVTPDGKKVYVTNSDSNTTSVIDTATNTVTATLTGVIGPAGVAVTPDGKKVYVANQDDDTVSVIDTANNTVTATVDVGSSPYGVAVTPDGKKVYVANYDDDSTSVIDTATNTVIATVDVGSGPSEISIGSGSMGNITETKNVTQPENSIQGFEQENGTTEVNVEQKSEQTQSPNVSGEGSTKTPDFEIIYGIVCLLAVFLYNRK